MRGGLGAAGARAGVAAGGAGGLGHTRVARVGGLGRTASPAGTYAWGRWVGMSYDGPVVTGWGAIARTEEQARQVVLDLINDSRS